MRDAVITNIINNACICVWLYFLVTNHRFHKAVTALISIGTSVLYTLLFIFFVHSFPAMTAMLLVYWSAVFMYTLSYMFLMQSGKLLTSLFFCSAYLCLWGFIYMIVLLTTGVFFGEGGAFVWIERIVLNAIALVLYLRFLRKKQIENIEFFDNAAGILFSASGLTFILLTLVIFTLTVNQFTPFVKLFGYFVTFLLFAFISCLIFRFLRQARSERESQQIAMQNKILLETVQSYEHMEQQLMQSRHDFRHHNLLILEYAKEGNTDAIIRYLGEYEQAESEKVSRRFSANKLVDSIMMAYSDKALREGIELRTDIRIPDSLNIGDIDLVAILANILENAINGCKASKEERGIMFSMKQRMQKIVIECQNPCGNVEMKNGMPVKRGVGIMSVKMSAEKYGGDLELSAENGVFNCSVILNNTV